MSTHWWRAYDGAVDHPKLLLLNDRQHRAWFNLLCLASGNGGVIPELKVVAIKLRMSAGKVQALLDQLIEAQLFDHDGNGQITPHNWGARQFKSDVSTERVKRFRAKPRNVSEAPPDTDSESETERKEDVAADAAPAASNSAYAFESGVIRLKQKDFDQWLQAFSHLDLRAELIALTEWAGQQPKWFFAVSSALAKRNREAKAAADKAQNFKWNGIEGVV